MLSVPGKALVFESISPRETQSIRIGFYHVYIKMFSHGVEWCGSRMIINDGND